MRVALGTARDSQIGPVSSREAGGRVRHHVGHDYVEACLIVACLMKLYRWWWWKEILLSYRPMGPTDISASIWSAGSGSRSRFKLIRISRVGLQG